MNDTTPRPGHVVAVTTLPTCALCGEPATWDLRTRFGPWANACDLCAPDIAAEPGRTGVGVGQRLVLAHEVPRPLTVGAVLEHKKRDLRFMMTPERSDAFAREGRTLVTDRPPPPPAPEKSWERFREVMRQREDDIARSVRRHVGTPRLDPDEHVAQLERERPVAWLEVLDPALAELEGENGVGLEQVVAAEAWLARQAR